MKPLASKIARHCQHLLMLALLSSSPAWTQEAAVQITPSDDRQGTFKSIKGEVNLVRAEIPRPAASGDGFLTTDKLLVGPKSAAALTLQDGTVIAVGPDSALALEKFSYDATTQEGSIAVRLLRGSLRMVTGLIAKLKPENVSVLTPTAVIGVRGTDFIVEATAP
ncbi:FecR family protein [Ottowia thiooxydans]|uniref:FecR family protein n=1 Tax=Ottowia thiooxydans TaxID=219182 RepID=UPI000A074994|nr:FecR family protein [Ottowia thiooxydans]